MECLIIAAGLGSRLAGLTESKPLLPLMGKPLLGHVMAQAAAGGVTGFVVVLGHRAEAVRAAAEEQARQLNRPVRFALSPDHHRPNGLSVLAAAELLAGPYLLTMCDHLIEPAAYQRLAAYPVSAGQAVLAVDRQLDNPLVDLDDVTRVATLDGRITAISKHLEPFDAFDMGLFKADPGLFLALQAVAEAGAEPSLSAGMMALTADGSARVADLSGLAWLDVDDPRMVDHAQRLLEAGAPFVTGSAPRD